MKKDYSRREFIRLNSVAGVSAALATGLLASCAGSKAITGASGSKYAIDEHDPANLKLTHRVKTWITDDDMLFLKQIGVRWVRAEFGVKEGSFEEIKAFQDKLAKYDIGIYSATHGSCSTKEVHLGLEGRDKDIERYQVFLKDIGRLGIKLASYSFHSATTYATASVQRRGYTAREFDLDTFRSKIEKQKYEREYDADEIWASYEYMMRALLPVAEASNVKMALHPDDPPLAKQNGVAKIFSHYDGIRRAEQIAGNNKAWGLCFCVGTWGEGGDKMGKSVIEMIHEFGKKDRLFEIHFRNVAGVLPKFVETFPDDGDMDMYAVMKALREVKFNGSVMPDHVPRLSGDIGILRAGTAYAIASMRAMLKRANHEVG